MLNIDLVDNLYASLSKRATAEPLLSSFQKQQADHELFQAHEGHQPLQT